MMKVSSRLNWKGSPIDPSQIGLNVQRERRLLKEMSACSRAGGGGEKMLLFFFNDLVISSAVQKSLIPSSQGQIEKSKCKVKSVVWYDRCALRDLPDLPKEKNMFEIVPTDERCKEPIRLYLGNAEEKKEVRKEENEKRRE